MREQERLYSMRYSHIDIVIALRVWLEVVCTNQIIGNNMQ